MNTRYPTNISIQQYKKEAAVNFSDVQALVTDDLNGPFATLMLRNNPAAETVAHKVKNIEYYIIRVPSSG